jgi:sugar lactone lactonase YvrE
MQKHMLKLAVMLIVAVIITHVLSLANIEEATAATLKIGDILVVDHLYGVIQINPDTGAQTVVSTGGYLNTSSNSARGIALEANGQILVTDTAITLTDGSLVGGVVRVNPATGTQTLLSSGGLLSQPLNVDVESDGYIVVTDRAGVIRIDPITGTQSLVSSGGNLSGPQGITIVQTKLKK